MHVTLTIYPLPLSIAFFKADVRSVNLVCSTSTTDIAASKLAVLVYNFTNNQA